LEKFVCVKPSHEKPLHYEMIFNIYPNAVLYITNSQQEARQTGHKRPHHFISQGFCFRYIFCYLI